jgi:hypothetical protein
VNEAGEGRAHVDHALDGARRGARRRPEAQHEVHTPDPYESLAEGPRFQRVEERIENHDGIGAVIKVNGSNWRMVRSGTSYCSQSEPTLTLGLGKAAQADSVDIAWPCDQRDTLRNLKANATYTIEEGGKLAATHLLAH